VGVRGLCIVQAGSTDLNKAAGQMGEARVQEGPLEMRP
jgi:hypothetical protein